MSRSPLSKSSLPSARLRVGDCTVDMPLREIMAPGARRPRRVTPKVIGVLAALIEQGGRVVSRDALLAQVWPGTLPTDDVVTQAITQLRKAFDDERGNPRYIETIAKYGYRLLASVEVLDDTGDGAAPAAAASAADDALSPGEPVFVRQPKPPVPSLPTTVRGDWRGIAAAVAVAGVLVAVMLAWFLRRDPPGEPLRQVSAVTTTGAPNFRLITSVPGIENNPTLSPDAALVAYVAVPSGQRHTAIMVQTTDPSTPRQLSHPEGEADDSAPAWSPNGREIAFLRVVNGHDCKVLLVTANGGAERTVGSCDPRNPPSFDWNHEGRGLVFGSRGTPGEGNGLRLLDLSSGEWRSLEYGATEQDLDFAPRYSPDGRWIVFVRNSPVGDLWRIPATGGTAQRLTRLRADIRGWDWMPDGRGIVLSRWVGSESRLLRLDLSSGMSQDMGINDGQEPAISERVAALAFTQSRTYFGIHRLTLGAAPSIERLYPSSGRDRLPVVAPDGHQLVFTSDRSGSFALWWSDLRRPESLRLFEGLRPESWHPPDWSGDSRRLLVVGTGDGGPGLYEVFPSSGQVVRLPTPDGDVIQALHVPGDDDRLLVIAGADDGRLRLSLYDRSVRPWQALATIDGVSVVRTDAKQRRVLFARPGRSGLWQADLDLSPGSVRQIDPSVPEARRQRSWTVGNDGQVYVLDRTPECATSLRRLGETSQVLCVDRNRRGSPAGFSLGPESDVMYITLSLWDGGDIGFMPLAVEPEVSGPS